MANSLQYANEQSLASLLQLEQLDTLDTLNCHQVGEIVSFDSSKQTAEVQIKMLRPFNGELKKYPILLDCPCVILGGGKGRITFPIEKGDSCLVLFNDKDIDNWYASGQTMQPRTPRMHNFADAIALVGIRNKQNRITDYLADGTELKYGGSTIKLENNKVTITNGTAQIEMSSGSITITGSELSVVAPSVAFSGAVSIATSLTVAGKDVGPNHQHSGVRSGTENTGGVV